MGYGVYLFTDQVHDELKCPICYRVLEEPVSGHLCDHLYCHKCIKAWLQRSFECPMDRVHLIESDLKPAPKIIIALLKKLKINCPNRELGCCWTVSLGDIDSHLSWCFFNNSTQASSSSNLMSPIKQMRVIGDQSKNIEEMKSKVSEIKENFEQQLENSQNISKNIENFKKKCQQLNNCLQALTSMLTDLLIIKDIPTSKKEDNITQENQIVFVHIGNLSEFVTTEILREYLRQNEIIMVDCELEASHYQRSRDFKVTIHFSDLEKIIVPSLWPSGVSVYADTNKKKFKNLIFGSRTKDHSILKIESGITFW